MKTLKEIEEEYLNMDLTFSKKGNVHFWSLKIKEILEDISLKYVKQNQLSFGSDWCKGWDAAVDLVDEKIKHVIGE